MPNETLPQSPEADQPQARLVSPGEMAEAALIHVEGLTGELSYPKRAGILRYLHEAATVHCQRDGVDHLRLNAALGEVANMTGDPFLKRAEDIHAHKHRLRADV